MNETLADVLARHATPHETALGRPVTTPRDVLDFLVAMKGNDCFWTELQASQPVDARPVDLRHLRTALPVTAFPPTMSVEACLAGIGVDPADIAVILDSQAVSDTVTNRIAEAFAAGGPKDIARALESLIQESPAKPVMNKLSHRPSLAQGLGMIFTVCALAGMAFGSLTACYKGVTPEA